MVTVDLSQSFKKKIFLCDNFIKAVYSLHNTAKLHSRVILLDRF